MTELIKIHKGIQKDRTVCHLGTGTLVVSLCAQVAGAGSGKLENQVVPSSPWDSTILIQFSNFFAGFIQDMSTDLSSFRMKIILNAWKLQTIRVCAVPASFFEGNAIAIGTCYIRCEQTHMLRLELKPLKASRYSHSGRDIGCFPNMSLAKATLGI